MGFNTAMDLANELDLEMAIGIHLRNNHYPPVPLAMVQPCIDAIDAYWEEDFDREINLPEDITYKGKTSAPAYAIIDAHHLQAWLMDESV